MPPDDPQSDLLIFVPAQLDDYGLPSPMFRVYAAVARNAGKAGVCFASVKTIARRCRLRLDRVRDSLKQLHALGLIGKKELPGKTTSYTLTPIQSWKPSPFTSDPSETGVGVRKHTPPKRGEGRTMKREEGSPPDRGQGHPSETGVGEVYPSEGNLMKAIQGGSAAAAASPRKFSETEKIRAEKELPRIEARLETIKSQGSHVAGGSIVFTEAQRAERRKLFAKKAKLLEKLEWEV